MGTLDQVIAEQRYLNSAKKAFQEFVLRRGDQISGVSDEVEMPSASLDDEGRPRFRFALPERLVANDTGGAHLFLSEVLGHGYEFALRRFLDIHLMSDDVFVDVGAHWGVHSLSAASKLPRQISVLAIEPHPGNSARLRRWVSLNRFDSDIEVISKAIGRSDGIASMKVSSSSMGHAIRHAGSELAGTHIEVTMTTLDKLLAERPHLEWRRVILKIDAEGYESEVLAGAARLFASDVVAAVVWEKVGCYESAVEARLSGASLDFLTSRGFAHYCMEDENTGGRLLPLEGRQVLRNVYSLSRGFVPSDGYA